MILVTLEFVATKSMGYGGFLRGNPKSSISIGFSIIIHPLGGTSIPENPRIPSINQTWFAWKFPIYFRGHPPGLHPEHPDRRCWTGAAFNQARRLTRSMWNSAATLEVSGEEVLNIREISGKTTGNDRE